MNDTDRDTAGVVTHPPFIYAGFFLAAVALDYVWPFDTLRQLAPGPRYVVSAALFLIGGAFAVPALIGFRAAGTNIPTNRPTTALVTTGPYRYSRNPIYIGLTLAYCSLALATGVAWSLVLLTPLLIVMRYGVIAREEAYLSRKFGPAYDSYRASVRRWL